MSRKTVQQLRAEVRQLAHATNRDSNFYIDLLDSIDIGSDSLEDISDSENGDEVILEDDILEIRNERRLDVGVDGGESSVAINEGASISGLSQQGMKTVKSTRSCEVIYQEEQQENDSSNVSDADEHLAASRDGSVGFGARGKVRKKRRRVNGDVDLQKVDEQPDMHVESNEEHDGDVDLQEVDEQRDMHVEIVEEHDGDGDLQEVDEQPNMHVENDEEHDGDGDLQEVDEQRDMHDESDEEHVDDPGIPQRGRTRRRGRSNRRRGRSNRRRGRQPSRRRGSDSEFEYDSSGERNEHDEDECDLGVMRGRGRRQRVQPRRNVGRGRRGEPGWQWDDRTSFTPTEFLFDNRSSGMTNACSVTEASEEVDYFFEFFDQELMDQIVTETNRYYVYRKENNPEPSPRSRMAQFDNVTREEMYRFFTILMIMSHVKKNNINDYWSVDEIFELKFIRKLMVRDRFLQVLRQLHFVDNNKDPDGDKLFKVRPVLDYIRRKFQDKLNPFQKLCIDESLMLWRGRLGFQQYIKSKRHRFGVKLFVFCDCETDYILDFIVYTGVGTEIEHDEDLGMSGSVVKTFLANHLNNNHILYCDNWYTSPKLFKYLYDNKTGGVGTVRKDRKQMPALPNVNKGEFVTRHCNNILCVKWCDNRVVHLLNSVHVDKMVEIRKRTGDNVKKPECVIHYNKYMRIVDKTDMLLSGVECVRKTTRWYIKLFLHIMDMSVLNAFNLYLVNSGNKPPLLEFSKNIIRQLVARHYTATAISVPRHAGGQESRLTGRHFPAPIPPTATNPKPRRRCHVCSCTTRKPRKDQRTYIMCIECSTALCVIPCFMEYHTLRHY